MDLADKQLVASVLERGKRRRDDDDLHQPKDELDEAVRRRTGRSRRARRRGRRRRSEPGLGGAAGQARRRDRRRAHRRGARRDRRRHDRHRRPGPDVPQGDRQGAAAQRRGRGRPGQGDRARRADRRRAAEGRPLAVGVDQERDRAEDSHQVPAAPPALQGRDRPHRARRLRRGREATACSSPRPTSTSSRRSATAEGDPAKAVAEGSQATRR